MVVYLDAIIGGGFDEHVMGVLFPMVNFWILEGSLRLSVNRGGLDKWDGGDGWGKKRV